MRTIVLVLAATSALALTAQQANAQDFTGPRAEVSVGYDSTNSDDGVAGTPNKLDGVRVGGAIGYDVALGDKITLGAEAGIGFIASGDARYTAGITSYRLTTGRDLDLSLRVGYKVAPRTLIYAKGGWANSQYRARLTGGTQAEQEGDGGPARRRRRAAPHGVRPVEQAPGLGGVRGAGDVSGHGGRPLVGLPL